MTYVFLIFMVASGSSSSKHIVPMESMEQCKAAITANKKYDTDYDSSHFGNSKKVNGIRCVEVNQ